MNSKKYIIVICLMIVSCHIIAQHCNINRNKPATATATWMPYVASNANDGTFAFGWAAPAFPPQNIYFDLQDTIILNTIHLVIGQSPAGVTSHDIYTSLDMITWTLVGSINQFTTSGDILIKNFIPGVPNVRGVKVETVSGPSWVAWQEIEINPLDSASIDTLVIPSCNSLGQIAVIDSGGTGALQYSIDGGSTFQSSNIFSNLTGGNYTIIVQDSIGCRDTTFLSFNVNIPIVEVSTTDSILCISDSTTLLGNASNNYQWNTGDTTQNIIVTPSSSQYYYLSTTDTVGCTVTDSIFITVNSLPNILINGNDSICQNDSLTVSASGGLFYSWSNGSNNTSTSYFLNSSGYIILNGTDANDCANSDSLFVNVVILSNLFIIGDTTICEGDIVNLSVNSGSTFLWNTAETTQSISVSPITTTSYNVYVASGLCSDSLAHTINVTPVPVLSVPSNNTITNGETVNLITNNINHINWTPNEYISCDTCNITTATPTSTTTYCINYNNNGCTASNCFTVFVDAQCGDFFIPNIFSPNDDGLNDILTVQGNCISNFNIMIFNRWGNKVFETSNQTNYWDGKINGLNASKGVYYYTATFTDNNSTIQTINGNITLIR